MSRNYGSWGEAFGEEAADKASRHACPIRAGAVLALRLRWLSHRFPVRLQQGGLFFDPVAGCSRAGSSIEDGGRSTSVLVVYGGMVFPWMRGHGGWRPNVIIGGARERQGRLE
jgi:hypothetical protein